MHITKWERLRAHSQIKNGSVKLKLCIYTKRSYVRRGEKEKKRRVTRCRKNSTITCFILRSSICRSGRETAMHGKWHTSRTAYRCLKRAVCTRSAFRSRRERLKGNDSGWEQLANGHGLATFSTTLTHSAPSSQRLTLSFPLVPYSSPYGRSMMWA